MRILLSTENFDAFGGTETYTLTVAQELTRLGHQVAIYTKHAGAMARLAGEQGVQVLGAQPSTRTPATDDHPGESGADDLPGSCDAVLAQDAATCLELAGRYPQALRVLVVHSRDHVLQEAPQLPGVYHGVVALNERVARWIEARAWHPPLSRLRQPLALSRFSDLPPPLPQPQRVLVTSNYVMGPRSRLIEDACRIAGYEVRWIGATSHPIARPEHAIADADIVIGLGRSALEGMAAGRAVYVYGALGAGGWVTAQSYPELEADGFAGLNDTHPADAQWLAQQLERWQPEMGEANRDLASANHSVRTHAVQLVELLHDLAADPVSAADSRPSAGGGPSKAGDQSSPPGGQAPTTPSSPPLPVEELARMARLEWQMYGQLMDARRRVGMVQAERDSHRAGETAALERVAELEEQLLASGRHTHQLEQATRELLATRRYRALQILLRPLDLLRARLRARSQQ